MSTVKKCDICGEIMSMYPEANEKQMGISILEKGKHIEGVYGEDEFDCCPECTESILRFIDVMKTYPDLWRIDIYDRD